MTFAFGASTFIWTSPFSDEKVGELARHVKQLGFDILEICVEDPALVTAERLRVAAGEGGVAISGCGAFGPERDVSHEDAAVRRNGVDYVKLCIDLAAAVGSPHVAGPMYSA